jgi:uncharacterized protein (TIGR02118 family)
MYKVAWIARFPKGKDRAEADRYWAEVHGPMFAKVPRVKRYVQSHVTGPLPRVTGVTEEQTHFDGYSCAWWDDREAFQASMRTPEWDEVVADGDNVFDMAWLWNMSAQIREVVQIDGPVAPYKVVWVMKFRPDIPREQADEHWTTVHGPIFHGLPIERYVQNHVVGPIGAEGENDVEIGFDGFSECWFADEAQFADAVNSPAWAEAVVDADNVFDMNHMWGAVLREHVVKDGRVGSPAGTSP